MKEKEILVSTTVKFSISFLFSNNKSLDLESKFANTAVLAIPALSNIAIFFNKRFSLVKMSFIRIKVLIELNPFVIFLRNGIIRR